jgi:hypothetical protein
MLFFFNFKPVFSNILLKKITSRKINVCFQGCSKYFLILHCFSHCVKLVNCLSYYTQIKVIKFNSFQSGSLFLYLPKNCMALLIIHKPSLWIAGHVSVLQFEATIKNMTRLIAQQYFINFSCHESFTSYRFSLIYNLKPSTRKTAY